MWIQLLVRWSLMAGALVAVGGAAADQTAASGLAVVSSLSDPMLRGARGIALAGHYAFVASQRANALVVVDIARPTTPQIVATLADDRLRGATGIAIVAGKAYVAARKSGRLVVVNIEDPLHPAILGSIGGMALWTAAKVALVGDLALVTAIDVNTLALVDIRDARAPVLLGATQAAIELYQADGIAVAGSRAYVAGGDASIGRLTVVDVADAAHPRVLGSLVESRLKGAGAVVVSGHYAYVAAIDADALTVVDIAEPTALRIAGSITTGTGYTSPTADLRDLVLLLPYAYVVGWANARLTVIEVSDPAHPRLARSLTDPRLKGARALAIDGRYAYVAVFDRAALTVVDLEATRP